MVPSIARRALMTGAAAVLVSSMLPTDYVRAATAQVRLAPKVGPPTLPFSIAGRGFGASEVVDLTFDATPIGNATTDPMGAFSKRAAVPSEALPGLHTVTATGETSGLTASSPFTVRTNWPRFQFDSGNSGFNPFENVLDPSNVGTLVLKWAVPTADGGSPNPVVSGAVVFVASIDGMVHALDQRTGATLWATDVGGTPTGLAVEVRAGSLYVSESHGLLTALSVSSGAKEWTTDLGDSSTGSPTFAGGFLYGIGVHDGGGSYVYSVEAASGALVWTSDTTSDTPYTAVADGLVYTSSELFGGGVVARDAATGRVVWTKALCPIEDCEHGSVSAADGLVFINDFLQLYALDAMGAGVRWVAPVYPTSDAVPAIADGVVYDGVFPDSLDAFDERTGALVWSTHLPGEVIVSSAAVANGVVYIGTEAGRLHAVDASTGEVLWTSLTDGSGIRGAPAVSDGRVYVGSDHGMVWAYGLP